MTEYESVVDEFERLSSERKCRHDGQRQWVFDIGHLTVAWLCDKCLQELISTWKMKLLNSKLKGRVKEWDYMKT